MTSSGRVYLACICAIVLNACAAPTVEYSMLQDGKSNPEGRQKFRFAHSALSVDQKSTGGYTATPVLLENPTDPYYTAFGSSMAWGVKTHIGFKYKPNSILLDTADISVEDNRIKYIDAAGSIVGTVAGLAVGAAGAPIAPPGKPPVPTSIALDPYLSVELPNECTDEEHYRSCAFDLATGSDGSTWQVVLNIYPPSPDAIRVEDFQQKHLGKNETSLFYSSCREINIIVSTKSNLPTAPRVSAAPTQILAAAVRVADPGYLEAIALPDKGTVAFRSDCGAEISSQPSGVSSGLEVTAEALKQIKSAYDSTHAKSAATKSASASK